MLQLMCFWQNPLRERGGVCCVVGFCVGVFVCVYVGGFLEDLYMKSEIQTGLKFDKFRQITVRVYVQKGFVAYRTYSIVIQCTPCS